MARGGGMAAGANPRTNKIVFLPVCSQINYRHHVEEKKENLWAKTFCTMNSSMCSLKLTLVENLSCVFALLAVCPSQTTFSLSLGFSFSIASSCFLCSLSVSVPKISTHIQAKFCSEVIGDFSCSSVSLLGWMIFVYWSTH